MTDLSASRDSDTDTRDEPRRSLRELIQSVSDAADPPSVRVGEILDALGDRSFAPALLVPALILVSPVSGIPGVPTVGGIIIVLVTVQWMIHRDHLWLPDWILRRSITSKRLRNGLEKLERVASWLDDHSGRRLSFLAKPPVRPVVFLSIIAIAVSWPFLELLPMVTSIGAAAVSLMAFGLWVRDGLLIIGGYIAAAALYLTVFFLASSLF